MQFYASLIIKMLFGTGSTLQNNMKTLSFIKAAFLLMLCVNFSSCSSDDDSGEGNSKENPGNELVAQMSADEKLLVGRWEADGNPLFLYSDKTCITPDGNGGTYSFDSKTKELVTTSGWGIRIVKSLDNKAMVLQGVQTTKVWTYRRQGNFVDKQFNQLLTGKWQNIETPEKIIIFSSDKYILDSKEGSYAVKEGKNRIYLDIDQGLYVPTMVHLDCYTLELTGEKLFKGTYKRIM